MARIPYADPSRPDIAALAERITRERGGRMLNLYRMLLNSPPVAEGWLTLFTAIRQKAKLADRYRELATLRVAVLNGADYEFQAHIPFALKSGVTQAQIDQIRDGAAPAGLTPTDLAVLDYTTAMTRSIRVDDATFASIREHFDEQEIVELTATIAGYNLVSRFLEALHIDHDRH
jgi:alkylhydroperoxidase family enzyme